MAKGNVGESPAVQVHPWGSLASTCTGLDEGKFFFQGGDNGCEGGGLGLGLGLGLSCVSGGDKGYEGLG